MSARRYREWLGFSVYYMLIVPAGLTDGWGKIDRWQDNIPYSTNPWNTLGKLRKYYLGAYRKHGNTQFIQEPWAKFPAKFNLSPPPPLSVRVPGSNFWHTHVPNFYSGVVGKHTSYRYGTGYQNTGIRKKCAVWLIICAYCAWAPVLNW